MDQATFQWLAGLAISGIVGLVIWIARDFNEKLRDCRADNEKLRDSLDAKALALHNRINEKEEQIADLRETTAGFQGVFITREEHARFCQQMRQREG